MYALRRSTAFRPFFVPVFTAALFAAVVAPTARAQSSVFASDAGWSGCPPVGPWDSGPVAYSAQSCVRAGITSDSWASANYGVVRTSAFSSITKNTFGFNSNAGTATWWDWLAITSGAASFAKFDFVVRGNTTRSTGNQTGAHSYWDSYATASFSSTTNGSFYDVIRNYSEIATDGLDNPYLQPSDITYFDSFSLVVPVVNGQAYLKYTMKSTSYVGVKNIWTNPGIAENRAFSAVSNFGSTAGVTGVSFLDGGGQTVNDVSYAFRNGTQFYDPYTPTSTVPEPSTWMLMGVGLAGLLAITRARRHA